MCVQKLKKFNDMRPTFFLPLGQTSEQAWDKIFEVNVKAAFLLSKEAAPHLEKTKG